MTTLVPSANRIGKEYLSGINGRYIIDIDKKQHRP
jgi:hypothetical protein